MTARIETVGHIGGALSGVVDALIQDVTALDGVPPVGEHKYLKLHNGTESVRAVLAWDGERLLGYAQLLIAGELATIEVVVHPLARRHGIGRLLLGTIQAVARAAGVREVKVWAYGALPASEAIAAHHGILPSRSLLQLEMPLENLPSTCLPSAYAIRTFDVQRDRAQWLQVHNDVFADHPENGTWSAEDLDMRLRQPWFDAGDFLLAERDGRIVGFNWLKRVPESPPDRPEGEIYIIGVGDSERGRGLGRALALLGLHHLRAEGMKTCTLFVEADNEPALRLYRSLGFRTRHTHRCYTVPLAVLTLPTVGTAAPAPGLAPRSACR
ncbi:MAG: mycothiol synthase [Chloroflexi bacterium]|nr:mycothiol synthase [Chloroflexota bacterium]